MSNMPRKEVIDWLCRLRSNIPTFMPKIWHEKFINALDYAISSLEVDEAYQLEFEKPGFCEDCISREQAKAAIRDKFKDLPSRVEINTILNELPSVTPQEPKTGHWNEIPKYKDIAWRCSECEHFTTMKHNFCPNCGADMREVVEE